MNKKISENTTIEELEKQLQAFKILNKGTQFLGVNLIEEITTLEKNLKELSVLPDQFNEIYSSKGWIAHESLPINIMKECIALGVEGEQILINYYESTLDQLISQISYKPIFEERVNLLKLAKEDYSAGRYHSSIPIVLMLVDGIVNDVKNTGLFADSTDLDVWDSIAGHSTGLQALVSILKCNRKKTNNEPIDLPYRNGILHGRDLNYANRNVAIKTFAILFYVYDWIATLNNEDKRKKEHLEKEKTIRETSLFDVMGEYGEHRKKMKKFEELEKEWEPRQFSEDIESIVLDDNTPESASLEFLEYIKIGNYGSPVSFYLESIHGKVTVREKAGQLKKAYKDIKINSFFLKNIKDIGSAHTEVGIIINYELDNLSKEKEIQLRMIYELNGETISRLVEGGKWKISNIEKLAIQLKWG
ncbi:hypothetical protein [Marinilactibacillus psychrotolerans]|uniref:hypothetical protein n=1 Tax=Marinilactibacillus psychrotolerans TaxID=191770 RepID=UPI0038881E40